MWLISIGLVGRSGSGNQNFRSEQEFVGDDRQFAGQGGELFGVDIQVLDPFDQGEGNLWMFEDSSMEFLADWPMTWDMSVVPLEISAMDRVILPVPWRFADIEPRCR